MTEVSAGNRTFRVHTKERQREWIAYAERADTGDRFGLEWSGSTEAEAVDRASRWLTWQHEHAAALDALQDVERAYHRAITGAAFGPEASGGTGESGDAQELLEQITAERIKLDAIRAERPS